MRAALLIGSIAAIAVSAGAQPGVLLETVPNPVPQVNANFGQTVSSTGWADRFVVAAPGADQTRGRVDVFETTSVAHIRSITNSFNPGENRGELGYSLTPASNGFAAGAPSSLTSGVAVLYTGYDFQVETNYTPLPSGQPGYAQALTASGSRLFSGNPQHGASDEGIVYAHVFNSLTTTTVNTPFYNNGNAGYSLGVFITGELAVGAPGVETPFPGGALHVLSSTGVTFQRTITTSEGQPGDRLGASIAIAGTNVLAGAPQASSGSGRAYVFTRFGVPQLSLTPPASGGGEFGAAVAAGDNYLVVGAPGYGAPNSPGSGRVYVFDGTVGNLLLTIENPTPAAGDRFGASVKFIGSRLLIGAPGDDSIGLNSGTAYVFAGPLGPPDLTAAALNSSAIQLTWATNALPGHSISIERRTTETLPYSVVATVPYNSTSYIDGGLPKSTNLCYRIRVQSSSGVMGGYSNIACATTSDEPPPDLIAEIPNPDETTNTQFGQVVAAVGKSRFAVGAPGAGSIGKVYLFNAATGNLEHTIENPRPLGYSGDQFGFAIGSLGEDLLVGAPGAETDYTGGTAYRFSSATGQLLNTYYIPQLTAGVNPRFGAAISGFGKAVVVGAPSSGLAAPGAGAAFVLDAATGAMIDVLLETNLLASDQFGTRIAASKKNVFVTAPQHDADGFNRGAVFAFDKKSLSMGWAGHAFSVASTGKYSIVGAPGVNSGTIQSDYGYAYLFTGQTVRRVYANPAMRLYDLFGYAVAGDKKNALIGAPRWDGVAESSGRAYLLDQRYGRTLKTFENPTPQDGDQFGYSLAIAGKGLAVIGAPYDDTAAPESGAVYLYSTASPKKKK